VGPPRRVHPSSELHLTNQKEYLMSFVECPQCKGIGGNLRPGLDPPTPSAYWEACPECRGMGEV